MYSAFAVGTVALRRIFNSPELGLAVFCMLQSECSQLQAMDINLQAQGLWNTEHTESPGEKETSDLQRYVLVLSGQSVAMLFTVGNTFSWGLLGRGMILKLKTGWTAVGTMEIHYKGAPGVEWRSTTLKGFAPLLPENEKYNTQEVSSSHPFCCSVNHSWLLTVQEESLQKW